MAADKVKMGSEHVEGLAAVIGGRVTRGSGNQWDDPIDARQDRHNEEFAFAAEGKSTLGQSISFSRDLIAKAREQAGGERPLIGLRFYRTEDLREVDEDWAAILLADLAELLDAARERDSLRVQLEAAEERARELGDQETPDGAGPSAEVMQLRAELAELTTRYAQAEAGHRTAQESLSQVSQALAAVGMSDPAAVMAELQRLRADSEFKSRIIAAQRDQLQGGQRSTLQAAMASPPPVLPWLAVFQVPDPQPGQQRHVGIWYGPDGQLTEVSVSSVRIENSAQNQPRLIVNEQRVPAGELYIGGQLHTRILPEQPGQPVPSFPQPEVPGDGRAV